MNEFTTVLNAVIPVFAIMAAGLGIRRLDWLSEEADQSLFRVVVNFPTRHSLPWCSPSDSISPERPATCRPRS